MAHTFGCSYSGSFYHLLSLLIMEAVWIAIVFVIWYVFAVIVSERLMIKAGWESNGYFLFHLCLVL